MRLSYHATQTMATAHDDRISAMKNAYAELEERLVRGKDELEETQARLAASRRLSSALVKEYADMQRQMHLSWAARTGAVRTQIWMLSNDVGEVLAELSEIDVRFASDFAQAREIEQRQQLHAAHHNEWAANHDAQHRRRVYAALCQQQQWRIKCRALWHWSAGMHVTRIITRSQFHAAATLTIQGSRMCAGTARWLLFRQFVAWGTEVCARKLDRRQNRLAETLKPDARRQRGRVLGA